MKLFAILAVLPFINSWSFEPSPFDSREATIVDIHNALFSGSTSCREVILSFLTRIETFNPAINAIISLNPYSLGLADKLDQALASGNATGSLYCIPVLLKDNFDAVGMNTTAGCLGLKDNRPVEDGPIVRAFKDAGAVILGKTNMHEMALEGLTVSSLGGQTINPYDHNRTPGGSSGGTGAAIAANFAVIGTGTDAVNSLRSPASANCLFSLRPTSGLLSRAGVIPVSYTQDTVGPITRTTGDLAVALTVMASVGYDTNDNLTALRPESSIGVDYLERITRSGLKGLRFGLVQGFLNRTASEETTPVNDIMDNTVSVLESAGATVVSIDEIMYNATAILGLDVQAYEYREGLDSYLQRPSFSSDQPSNFKELYSSEKFLVIPAQYNFIDKASKSSTSDASYIQTKLKIEELTSTLRSTFSSNNLDALIYPQQKNLIVRIGTPSQAGRNGILAALTGSPVVTIPAGFSPFSDEAPIGVPVGMEILGLPWTEDKLLDIAANLESILRVRRMSTFANMSVEAREYNEVPNINPGVNIPDCYPAGTLKAT